MAEPRLRAVSRTQGNNAALKNGSVQPRGFALEFEEVPVLVHAFRRMVRELAYDVCEMAFTTYLCARAHGTPFTALPIFLVRGIHHGAIVRHPGSAIHVPADLEGRRVGVNRGYTVTTGVWARGILADEYGVDLGRVTWARTGDEHVADYRPPPNVETLGEDTPLAARVASGELVAAVGITADQPGLEPLIPDPMTVGLAALRTTGLYPINHVVVVRDDVLAEHPGLAPALFEAFAEAKRRYVALLAAGRVTDPSPADLLHERVMDVTGGDPLPYGIEPNRAVIERLVRHAVAQRIIPEAPPIEGLFAAGTAGLAG